ncbi:class-II fumarase/aspartase family protein [Chelativorans sp. YIM 93263]|uniref:class-II fumarase/aspartase family protein n=1 Tax=Chelativorans sp. YIM 93263 TaxID=2906648 RepID=UPI002378FF7F|nr:adenylosuccinate lyase family protein [Chelativorans sp. YIM 93263]
MAHIIDHSYYRDSWGTAEMRAVFDDERRFQRWLDFWAILAEIQAEEGIIPKEAAAEIAAKARVDKLDPDYIRQELAKAGHTLVPVLRAFEKACEKGAGEWIHYGPTTQDIQDTALAMEMKDAWTVLFRNIKALEIVCLEQADRYKDLVMVGRTHNQHALPMTLGMKLASWAAELRRDLERLKAVPDRAFFIMLHGGVGTMAGLGPDSKAIVKRMAERLDLVYPPTSWASARDGIAEFLSVLGICAGTLGRIANEVFQLSRTELGEIHEPISDTMVGSSTMPHKRNAVRSEFSGTMVKVVMNNVTLGLQSMVVSHERDASVWRLDWHTVPESAIMLDRVVNHMRTVVGDLAVDENRIAENLDLTNGAIMSEALMFRLGEKLGKQSAHHVLHEIVVEAARSRKPFRQAVLESENLKNEINAEELESILDYREYLGTATTQVEDTIALSKQLSVSDPQQE